VSKVMEALNSKGKSLKGSKVLVLGVAYKKDIDDMRESPSVHLIELLIKKGAVVEYNDPYVLRIPKLRGHNLNMKSVELKEISGYDCILIATNHSSYNYKWIVDNSQLVVDTRNATSRIKSKNIVKA